MIEIDNESIELSKKYLDKAIIPMGKVNDALHVAVSTVYEMDALINWNYKHLANLRRKELIQSVNLIEGYTKTLSMEDRVNKIRADVDTILTENKLVLKIVKRGKVKSS